WSRRSTLLLERGCGGSPEVDVEVIRGGPIGLRVVDREGRDHPLLRPLVTDGVEDRVVWEERVAWEVHLRDKALGKGASHQREVDVRGTPGVVVVAPGVGARLDRRERVAPLIVGDAATGAVEVGVQGGGPAVPAVAV